MQQARQSEVGHAAGAARVVELGAALEAALARELLRAYRQLNAVHFDQSLRTPVLRLTDHTTALGRWDRVRRSIEISRPMLLAAPWGAVLEVLKHEMAHQYAHEVLGAVDEASHGPAFRDVCRRMGIDARAAGLPEASADDDPERARLLKRIAGLLALAESPHRHEAETAAALAQRLMLKHNIAVASAPVAARDAALPRYGFRHLGEPTGRVPEAAHLLASILAEHFFVEAIWVPVYRPREGRHGSVLEICGREENLEMASYVHAFLSGTAERLWREHKRVEAVRGDRDRRTYLAGVMEGFRERLRSEGKKAREQGLVWLGDADLKGFYRQRHPHVRHVRVGGYGGSEARSHGREAGRHIVLRRGVGQGASAGGHGGPRALPPKRG
ncbi:MAG: DUF2786 domain-containing protein [Myxococcales bacterium]|nr:DUF2786 domain-containing protein [Myxococcales bacterium]